MLLPSAHAHPAIATPWIQRPQTGQSRRVPGRIQEVGGAEDSQWWPDLGPGKRERGWGRAERGPAVPVAVSQKNICAATPSLPPDHALALLFFLPWRSGFSLSLRWLLMAPLS